MPLNIKRNKFFGSKKGKPQIITIKFEDGQITFKSQINDEQKDLSDEFESSKYLRREIKQKIYFYNSTPAFNGIISSNRQESFDSFLNINSFDDRLSTDSIHEIRKTNLKTVRNIKFSLSQKRLVIKKRSVKMSTNSSCEEDI